jgi:dolichol-phosphate mannosyltransferase
MKRQSFFTVDIVTSALDEELCLPELIIRLQKVFSKEHNYKYRLTIIDNGSSDETWSIIVNHASRNKNIRGIRMSRTFPFDAALTCGLDYADCDYLVIMASDLQDPPETIENLLREIEKGFDQVIVRVEKRDEVPALRRFLSYVFYRINFWSTDGLIPKNVSDFRIMNRKVYTQVKLLRESHRFMRGLSAWVGFKTSEVTISRPNRFAGKSKWLSLSIFSALSIAVKGIFAFSTKPLSILSFLSFFLGSISLFSLLPLTIVFLTSGVPFGGFGSLIGFAVLSFALIMLSLGTIALYISLIYEETKNRPSYIIDEVIDQTKL